MKLLYTCLHVTSLLIALGTSTFAQTTVTGSIRDAAGKPLPFISMALMNARDSSLVKGTISKETGGYVFENIKPGQYRLIASGAGYTSTRTKTFDVTISSAEVHAIALSEPAKTLKEVTVATKKPFFEQEIDRMVINVAGSIIATGSTALEVLEKNPGVTVDRQNDALQLRGKDGVIVQIDGKQTYLSTKDVVNILKNMLSDNIEKIELITNPGSRYDASGNSGIINIRLKKNQNLGTNGAVSLSGAAGRFDRERGNLQLNHREAKVNLFGNYSLNRGGDYWNFASDRDQPAQGDGTGANNDLTKRNFIEQSTYLKLSSLQLLFIDRRGIASGSPARQPDAHIGRHPDGKS